MRKQEPDGNDPKCFDVTVGELIANVSVHTIKSAKVFHLVYDNGREPLNMTIANADDGSKFWTSLPEGRQEEAELAGATVAAYLREYASTRILHHRQELPYHARSNAFGLPGTSAHKYRSYRNRSIGI